MFKGFSFALTAGATPWTTYLGSTQAIEPRFMVLTTIVSLVAFCTAGAAFLSTTVADEQNDKK